MQSFLTLTKMGIVLFVLLSGLIGYAISFPMGQPLDFEELLALLLGLYFVSAGSFAINQAQEWRVDVKMDRTRERPVPQGILRPWQALLVGLILCLVGLGVLYALNPVAAGLALLTILLYNGFYTLVWKRKWAFGAVPGAIPGALPVVIGYSVHKPVLSPESLYLFLVMFLWQMPHFWCLAIRFREDYSKGSIPVLPTQIGVSRTLYHIGLYVFAYVGLALAQPLFFRTNFLYLFLVVPLAFKVMYEFFRYFGTNGRKGWLSFFLWTNLSLLVFLGVPAFEKWLFKVPVRIW